MPDTRPIDHLATALVTALRRLGAAGEPETASRIAAQAYVAVRRDDARVAERINGVMHHLARLEAASQGGEADAGDGDDAGDGEGGEGEGGEGGG